MEQQELNVGECITPYIATKVNVKFDALHVALKELAEADKKKKNGSKAVPLFKQLTYCKPGIPLIVPSLAFLNYDHKQLQPLTHYFANFSLSSGNAAPAHISQKISAVLDKELAEKAMPVARRMLLLRTFCHILPSSDTSLSVQLITFIAALLRGEDLDAKQKKSKKSDKDANRRLGLLQQAALGGLRRRPLEKDLLTLVVGALGSDDPVAARHAAAIIIRYSQNRDHVNKLPSLLFATVMQKDTGPKLNMDDTLTRVYMVKLYHLLADQEGPAKGEMADKFYSLLTVRVRDKSARVCFETILALTELGWNRLALATMPARIEGDSNVIMMAGGGSAAPPGANLPAAQLQGSKVLTEVLSRLNSSLSFSSTKTQSRPLLFASLRALTALAQCFIKYTRSQKGECKEQDPLHLFLAPLHAVLNQAPPQLRLESLKALIWIAHSESCEREVHDIILQELKSDSLQANLIQKLYEEVHLRVKASPRSAPFAIDLCEEVIFQRPEKAPSAIITDLYSTIVDIPSVTKPDGEEIKGSVLVLESIFRILDRRFRSHTRSAVLRLETSFVWFLGENCQKLVAEPEAHCSVFLCLQHISSFGNWESRIVAGDALIKLAENASTPDQKRKVLSYVQNTTQKFSF